jgi:hypothetical protein
MPTPMYSDILISVVDNDEVICLKNVAIPRNILPNSTITAILDGLDFEFRPI